ncbi:MAG TPA: hypothetical protein DEE98_06350 [Elusimicrobia bacterium]|nr:MAG: hypothetical protein A2278_02250 [Elusimicrobia bacterium RIFOXYA12_FULL_49_49]OGS06207.1 MAG: hypothetical protein A2204_02170 [Elusimicrobia bacterium RIFOXYA1_FULL_47_7]OGS16868.1 MAG: hypothetical protein A2251_05700 [Elusimicrobia bacterium RIFOXYA2_FULL_47_53]OGS32096.1 MAG: hypothetical protein A2323_08475 [Elusimicrobia bacterium RIFOXYB2_FULL_46_23]HBU69991.1 hypothetical protein [Elusimicrobiota bacterium]
MESVLIIDDEEGILKLLSKVLEAEGYKVTTLNSCANLDSLISTTFFDLVLTDLKMPDCNGMEILNKIRLIKPQTEVIIMTGQATIESAIASIKSGAFAYLLKPFNIEDVLVNVRKCLEHAKLSRKENIYRETTHLYQLAQQATKNNTQKELLNLILERAIKTLKADTGSIFMLVLDSNQLASVASFGLNEEELTRVGYGEKIVGWVAKNREAVLIQSGFENAPQFAELPSRSEIVSSLICPLINEDALIGVICLNRLVSQTNYQFTQNDLDSLKVFGVHSTLLISAMQYREAQRQLDELRSEFMSNVSHELRTPLMSIGGAIELLYPYMSILKDNDKVTMFFDLIKRNSTRMQLLVNDLLDFSRMETNKLNLMPSWFNLKVLIDETLQDLHLRAKEKNIELIFKHSDGKIEIFGDNERIKQVIVNLIGNALKFTHSGGEVIISAKIEEGGKTVLLVVSDNGEGIPADKIGRIFEKFFQVDGSVSRTHAGFGLGLAIVKSIVEKHRGAIWAESEKGKGSKFFVRLPVNQEA